MLVRRPGVAMLASIAPLMVVTKHIFNNDVNPNFVQQSHQLNFARYLYNQNYTANSFLNLSKAKIIDLMKACFGYNQNSQWFSYYANNVPEMFQKPSDNETVVGPANKLAITNQ